MYEINTTNIVHVQIVPCNMLAEFKSFPGEQMSFQAQEDEEEMYKFDVYKEESRARIGGKIWHKYVEDHNLREGDEVFFDFSGVTRKVSCKNKRKGPIGPIVYTYGIDLTQQEKLNLHDLMDMKLGDVGSFFVHRFKKSNLQGKTMVCF